MQEIDNNSISDNVDHIDEHHLFMNDVIQDDHQLLYLDSYLSEILNNESESIEGV